VRQSPDVNAPADSAALRHLQQVHAPVLVTFLARLTGGDRYRAEEVARETMARAGRNPDAWDGETRWSRAWLFTTARSILADQAGSTGAETAEPPWPDTRTVRAALDSLPERLRITLVEIYFRERSAADAADALDVPGGTVEARIQHALRSLRAELDGRGFDFGSTGPEEHEKKSVEP
jgi:RNA polymerase sigma-70 factor (ECF subfamily)